MVVHSLLAKSAKEERESEEILFGTMDFLRLFISSALSCRLANNKKNLEKIQMRKNGGCRIYESAISFILKELRAPISNDPILPELLEHIRERMYRAQRMQCCVLY